MRKPALHAVLYACALKFSGAPQTRYYEYNYRPDMCQMGKMGNFGILTKDTKDVKEI